MLPENRRPLFGLGVFPQHYVHSFVQFMSLHWMKSSSSELALQSLSVPLYMHDWQLMSAKQSVASMQQAVLKQVAQLWLPDTNPESQIG